MLTQTINYSTLEDQLPIKNGYSGLHRGRRNSWDSPVKPKLSIYHIRNRRSSICDTEGTTRLRNSANGVRGDNFTVPLSSGLSPVSRYRSMHGTALNRIQGYSARMVSCLLLGTILLMGVAAVFILMQSVPSGVTSGKFRGAVPELMGTETSLEAESRSTAVTESTKIADPPAVGPVTESAKTADLPAVGPVTSSTRSRRAQRMIARHDANKVANNTKREQESDYIETNLNQNQEYKDFSAPNFPKMENSTIKVGSFDLRTHNSEKLASDSHQLAKPIEAANIPVSAASPDVLFYQSGTEKPTVQVDRISRSGIENPRQPVIPSGQFYVPYPVNYQSVAERNQEQNTLLHQPLAQNVFQDHHQQQSQPVIPPSNNQWPMSGSQQGNFVNPSLGMLPNAIQDDTMEQPDNWSSAQAQPLFSNQPRISSQDEDHLKVGLTVPSVPASPAYAYQSTSSDPAPNSAGPFLPGQTAQGQAEPGTSSESPVAPEETNVTPQVEHPSVLGNEQPSNLSAASEEVKHEVEQEVQSEESSYRHPKNLHRLLKLSPKLTDAQVEESNPEAPVVPSSNDSLPKMTDLSEIAISSSHSVTPTRIPEVLSSTGVYSTIVIGLPLLNQTVEQSAEAPTQIKDSEEILEKALNVSGLVVDPQMSRQHYSNRGSANIILSDSNQEVIENYFRPKKTDFLQNFMNASHFFETPRRDLPSNPTLPSAPEQPRSEDKVVDSYVADSFEFGNGSNKTREVKDSAIWIAQQNQMQSRGHQNFAEMPAPQSLSRDLHGQTSGQQQQEQQQYQKQHEQQSIYVSNFQQQTSLPNLYSTDQLMYAVPKLPTADQSFFPEAEQKQHTNVPQADQGSLKSLPSVHQPTQQRTEFKISNSPTSNELWQRQQTLQTNYQTSLDSKPQLGPTPSTFQQDHWQNQQQHLLLQEHLLRQANLHQQQPQQQQQLQAPQPSPPWQLHQFATKNMQVQQQQTWTPKDAPSNNAPKPQQQDWPFKQVDSYQHNEWPPKQEDSYQKQEWPQHQVDQYNANSPHFPQTVFNYPGSVQPYPGLPETHVSGMSPPPYQNAPAINDFTHYNSQHRPSDVFSPHEPRWTYNSDGSASREVPVMEHPVLNPAENYPPGVNPNMYRLY